MWEQIKKGNLLFNLRRDFIIATNAHYGIHLGTDNSTDTGYSDHDLLRRLVSRVFAHELDIFWRFAFYGIHESVCDAIEYQLEAEVVFGSARACAIMSAYITGVLTEASGRFARQLAEGHPLNKITGEIKCEPSPAWETFNRERLALTSNIALNQGLAELGYSPANAPIPSTRAAGAGR